MDYRDNKLYELSKRHSINNNAFKEIIRLVIKMSDAGEGGLLTIGDYEKVLQLSENPNTDYMEYNNINVVDFDDEAIIGLLKQDGASIIDSNGNLMQTMTFLRPPIIDGYTKEAGRGSKHSTAGAVSKLTNALSIAIPVDGRITVYSQGEIAFKMMG